MAISAAFIAASSVEVSIGSPLCDHFRFTPVPLFVTGGCEVSAEWPMVDCVLWPRIVLAALLSDLIGSAVFEQPVMIMLNAKIIQNRIIVILRKGALKNCRGCEVNLAAVHQGKALVSELFKALQK